MERTQIQLTEEQARELRLRAAELDVSVAELIRRAVDRFLDSGDDQAAREGMVAAVGGFRSGRSDVSEAHDRDLGEAFRG